MSISAANVWPDFLARPSITSDELRELQEPAVIFEHEGVDDEGAPYFVYTVAGFLRGRNIATVQGGATVGGQVIIINSNRRDEADFLATHGLMTTLNALDSDAADTERSRRALERMNSVGAQEVIAQAMRRDKNEGFVDDAQAIQKLRGDDIVLMAGGTKT